MVKKIGFDFEVIRTPEEILKANKLILLGVGAFDTGILKLSQNDMVNALNEAVIKKGVPILGICLGMQLMTNKSEEGNLNGFGWVNADTRKFKFSTKEYRIPHMGWNTIEIINKNSPIVKWLEEMEDLRFYFVHSYYINCYNKEDIVATTTYGDQTFVSIFQRENIFGVQFHPEKSHKFGMKVLTNFLEV